MRLYLVRHAIAEDGAEDDLRALTPKGRRRFRAQVALLERLGVTFDRLLHSPKRRAVQTAELLVPLVEGETEVTTLLAAPPSAELLVRCVGARVGLVGHEPWLSQLLAWLIAADPGGALVELKKGAVAALEGTPRPKGMRLTWLLPPKVGRV